MSGRKDAPSSLPSAPFWGNRRHRPSGMPLDASTRDCALGYGDVALFFLGVVLLALGCRIAIRIGFLQPTALSEPSLPLQVAISLFLLLVLYCSVRFLHGPPVWSLLGWRQPNREDTIIAVLGGPSLALMVDVIAHATTAGTHVIRIPDLVLLAMILGPLVEESFFRGCLQPVIARSVGETISIVLTAVIFASLHSATSVVAWLCFTGTGMAYGYIRARSGSTAAAAFMHAAYNAALFLCQFR